ncbi:hypothetical protein [Corynebacterium sp. TAE3-ERU2]|uniref:hypothetical protein n=1 Tax=Corynebacterium sp. TAE3-ERU2 TaxID=2849497 RepID=UPI001C4932B0|nr:hypothetical protein [Corynebacterium sp. TAE3-ERU2]MBV7302608.1 hypothetical protein [Corynebacterium sp. TAE3-ERU2]
MSQTTPTPRSHFDSQISTLCADLSDFATGAYLSDGDTDYWEEPYPPAIVPLVESVLRGFLDRAYRCAEETGTASETALHREVDAAIAELERIDRSVDYALLDTEESAEFSDFFRAVCRSLGAPLEQEWELGESANDTE